MAGGQWRAVPGRKAGPGVGRWEEYGGSECVAGDGWLDGWLAGGTDDVAQYLRLWRGLWENP